MGSRRETVLDDWHAGLTYTQIAQSRKIPLGSVKRFVREARLLGDPRAKLRNKTYRAVSLSPAADVAPEEESENSEELVLRTKQAQRDCDAAALATLIKVHKHPSKVTTLQQASGAFRRRDVHPSAIASSQSIRDFGDPPPGRSALDQRRAG